MQIKYKLSKSASTHVEAIRVIRCTLRYSMALDKSIPAQQFAGRRIDMLDYVSSFP